MKYPNKYAEVDSNSNKQYVGVNKTCFSLLIKTLFFYIIIILLYIIYIYIYIYLFYLSYIPSSTNSHKKKITNKNVYLNFTHRTAFLNNTKCKT